MTLVELKAKFYDLLALRQRVEQDMEKLTQAIIAEQKKEPPKEEPKP